MDPRHLKIAKDNSLPLVRVDIGEEEVEAVTRVLRSGWLTSGTEVREFEERFADHIGTKHAVAVSSGTAALYLALRSLGIGPGDEVITSPMTFCSTANAIELTGATTVFADIDETGCVSPEMVANALSDRTRAVLPIHLYGQPADMDGLLRITAPRDIYLVEDAAHCPSASYKGMKVGTLGNAACFSFYAAKNLTTGEGGMLVTDDDNVAQQARVLRYHGLQEAGPRWEGTRSRVLVDKSFNFVMTDLAAALGKVQLHRLGKGQEARSVIWNRYLTRLEGASGIILPTISEGTTEHGMHLFTLQVEASARDAVRRRLKEQGIGTGIHYAPLHLEPYYRERYGQRNRNFLNAEAWGASTISLPLYAGMSVEDADRVVEALLAAVSSVCQQT